MEYVDINNLESNGYYESKMYPGLYANLYGSVLARSVRTGRIYRPKVWISDYGYLMIRYAGKIVRLHRVVADVWCDHPEGCDQINHKNGIKTQNAAYNLEWCTCRGNMLHAYSNGLNKVIGERIKKVPDECVNDIRDSCLPTSVLAEIYGCTARNILYIRSRQTRKSVS